jgi:hypothetical protein
VDSARVVSASAQPLDLGHMEGAGRRFISAGFPDGPLISLPWEGWWHDDPFSIWEDDLTGLHSPQ